VKKSSLVTRLRLVTHCIVGSAGPVTDFKRFITGGRASNAVRSQAEPGNENTNIDFFIASERKATLIRQLMIERCLV
jgi:hypothetical protein